MPAFDKARQQTDQEVMANLLTRLAEDPAVTQRTLASELGIALGLMSQYIKSCVRKGYIRSKRVAPRRWAYFVTPLGFVEKSRMVFSYLSSSMNFYREVRIQAEKVLRDCHQKKMRHIVAIGLGDVADIIMLVSKDFDVSLCLCEKEADFSSFEGVIVTDILDPQGVYDSLKLRVAEKKS